MTSERAGDDENPGANENGGSTRRRRGRRGGGRSDAARGDGQRTETPRAEPSREDTAANLPIASRRPGRKKTAPDDASSVTQSPPATEPKAATPAAPPEAPAQQALSSAEPAQPSRAAGGRGSGRQQSRAVATPGDADPTLAARIEHLTTVVDELRADVAKLMRRDRVGIFVDVPNLLYGAERGDRAIDVGKLLQYLTRQRELIRATAYAPVSDNPAEPVEQQRFVAPFVPHPYRIVTKSLKRFADGSIKGNFDVEMAIDMVLMADRIDVACIVSGDADFAKVVEILQQQGVRVEVIAFANSSSVEMRALADEFIELGTIAAQLRP